MGRLGFVFVMVLATTVASPALANDPAAAEALFRAAKAALAQGDLNAACDKFRESNVLDPAVGTLYNLADCEEQRGRTGTAWALFIEVRDRLDPEDGRNELVNQRIAQLEPRLSRLTIRLAPDAPSSTTVTREGILLGEASLGQPVVTDPGRQQLVVAADGYESRNFEVEVPAGGVAELEVAPGPEHRTPHSDPDPPPPVVPADEPTSLHPYGLSLIGLGVVGIGVGVGLGFAAKGSYEDAEARCPNNVCDQDGFTQRNDAITLSHVGTAVLIAGAAVGAAGLVIEVIELAGGTEIEPEATASTASMMPSSVRPWMGPDRRGWAAGMTMEWPF